MAGERNQSFLKGAAILTASTLIVKVLGLLFSIPLANFISDQGMSYFYAAYDIFTWFLMISTAGLPIAVSRMVGTAWSQNRRLEADRVFSVAFWVFFGLGLGGFLIMYLGADWLGNVFLATPGSGPAIRALSPTMFFISVMSALRGYSQGRSDMVPTAVSQTIEAVTKVVIGVGLAVYIIHVFGDSTMAAVGAVAGVSISAGLGTLYLTLYKLRQKRRDRLLAAEYDPTSASRRELFSTLLKFAVPITLGSCFLSLLDVVDSAILMHQLQGPAGFDENTAMFMRTCLGNARKYFDLPGAFVVPISTSLLPILSGAVAAQDADGARRMTSLSLRVTLLISVPCSVGMGLYAGPICDLLLPSKPETAAATAQLLTVLSAAIFLSAALMTTNAILQAYGHPVIPVITMGVGGLVKVGLSFLLTAMPEVNVFGSAISTVASYLVIMVLNFFALHRVQPRLGDVWRKALPMVLSSAVMGAVSFGVYWALTLVISRKIAVLAAIVVAVLVYAVCVVKTRAVAYEDIVLLPKGETLTRLLRMKKPEMEAEA